MEQEQKLDKEFLEIVQKANISEVLSEEELKKLEKEAKESLEFLKLIDEIKFPKDKYVIYNDGEEQLVYEDGEFFLQSATDSSKPRKKKKRLEAKDMYIEYVIKYIFNPIIERKKVIQMKKELIREKNTEKDVAKEKAEKEEKIKKDKTKKVEAKINNEVVEKQSKSINTRER